MRFSEVNKKGQCKRLGVAPYCGNCEEEHMCMKPVTKVR